VPTVLRTHRLRSVNFEHKWMHFIQSQKQASNTLTAFRREEDALVQEYQRRLEEVRARKQVSVDLANSIVSQINGTKHSIDELLALQAKLLEQQEKETDFASSSWKPTWRNIWRRLAPGELAADFQKAGVLEMFKAYRSGMTGFPQCRRYGPRERPYRQSFGIALLQQEFMKEFNRKPRLL